MEKSQTISDENKDIVYEEIRMQAMEMLRQQLPPEFYNRIDEMIVFHSLTKEEIQKIVQLQFNRLSENLKKQGISIELTSEALAYLARHGYQPEFGARPIKRLVQKEIINELARSIIEGTISKSHKIRVNFKGGKLSFDQVQKK
jgi:ATP-dependent Clp protease ATP-binding subunit ClpB